MILNPSRIFKGLAENDEPLNEEFPHNAARMVWKRGQEPFAGTALRVLRTKGS